MNTTIEAAIKQCLGSGSNWIKNPDHPFLYETPDFLVSGYQTLIGIFIVKGREKKQPDRLLQRLMLSRLGLPTNFRAIYVCSDEQFEIKHGVLLDRSFDRFVRFSEINKIKGWLSKPIPARSDAISFKVKMETFKRQSVLYNRFMERNDDSAKRRMRSERRKVPAPHVSKIYSWTKQDYIRSNLQIAESSNHLLLSVDQHQDFSRVRETAMFYSSRHDYFLDNGIPYVNDNNFYSKIKLITWQKFDLKTRDPLKQLRALTFAGCYPVNTNEPEFLDDLSNQLLKKYGK